MTISFNVQHSPMGAFSSFTIGHVRSRGGMGSELGRPAAQNVYIGHRRDGEESPSLLPFFEQTGGARAAFDAMEAANASHRTPGRIIAEDEIARSLGPATDEFRTGPLTVTVLSPYFPIDEPSSLDRDAARRASCPAVFVELTVDNRSGDRPISGVFALEDDTFRDFDEPSLRGAMVRGRRGFACRPEPDVSNFIEFDLHDGLAHAGKRIFRLGRVAGLVVEVPPGQSRSVVIALGFYLPGVVTTGLEATYWYAQHFESLADVLDFALSNYAFYKSEALARGQELEASRLNADQRFLVSQAIHSYFGSTAWLDVDGEPLWVVNEGEYVMMNTLDLTVDQAFFELRLFPWAVRSELDFFAERYAYRDSLRRPGSSDDIGPGGISFCHDIGVANQFSPPGVSSYELPGIDRACFSFMSCEELTNWILTAGLYVAKTGDSQFLTGRASLLRECLESLENRDDPTPAERTGLMGWDSSRTEAGGEITTYDSLDASLGQARENLYLAGKIWAAYVALEELFRRLGDGDLASRAGACAGRTAAAIVAGWNEALGFLPAIFDGKSRSAILPAIEALVYPKAMGLSAAIDPAGRFADLLRVLTQHFAAVFKPGICQFEDGGWKLSSTSNNSWMSKVAIAQHVARTVLAVHFAPEEQARQDHAHAEWQRKGSGYWAFSDQMVAGVARGSRYYPRGVTAILWLDE